MAQLNLRVKFFVLAVIISAIIAGWFLPQVVVPILDGNQSIHPLLASLVYYGFIFVVFSAFAYSFTGKFSKHTLRLTVIIYLLYLLIDWYEPPMVISPSGLIVQGAGWRASLDYSVGYTMRQIIPSLSWKDVYNTESWVVPASLAMAVILLSTPQLLGKALKEVS